MVEVEEGLQKILLDDQLEEEEEVRMEVKEVVDEAGTVNSS